MVKLEFYLNDEDADRVFALKKAAGKDDLTGNEYARELLEATLHRIHPKRPEFDEMGNAI